MTSKIQVLVAAAALAMGGAAFAQTDTRHDTHHDVNRDTTSQDAHDAGDRAKADMHSMGEKTKSEMHRMGDKFREWTHSDKSHHVAKGDRHDDTRAMGASRDTDHDRQARMDDAYSNWQSRTDRDRR